VRTCRQRSTTTHAGERIATYLAERPTGLAVIASHGRGGVLRWALGSTAEYVLDRAPCPIVIVRASSS
jgi:nucleotide-binding universal stress UspA family protein